MISEEQRTWREGLRADMAEVARPVYPTLREQVERCLLDAGFRSRASMIPGLLSGGTFDLVSGAGVLVRVEWWDAQEAEKRELLEAFADALKDKFTVEDRGDRLYVTEK